MVVQDKQCYDSGDRAEQVTQRSQHAGQHPDQTQRPTIVQLGNSSHNNNVQLTLALLPKARGTIQQQLEPQPYDWRQVHPPQVLQHAVVSRSTAP